MREGVCDTVIVTTLSRIQLMILTSDADCRNAAPGDGDISVGLLLVNVVSYQPLNGLY